jgi:hypothetical protein
MTYQLRRFFHAEWVHLQCLWTLLWLPPEARQAVLNATPETLRKLEAFLDARRDHPRCTPGCGRGKVSP